MSWALVTGDKGFVGSHFRRHLTAQGWNVMGYDIKDDLDAREMFIQQGEWPQGQFDLVIHCAAIVGGREVIDGAPLALASNLELDAGLFQWALKARPGRVVYFSSSAAYPVHLQQAIHKMPMREGMVDPALLRSTQGAPDQLYGWAKLTGENLAHRARLEGLKVSVVRPFSGYGEDQDASYPFPAFIDRALRREDPFTIWGDGRQVRDFIHIKDIVGAVMTMVAQDIDGPVNLATGRATDLNELAWLVCRAAGYSPEIAHATAKPAGVQYRVGAPDRLHQFYVPEIGLEDGIDAALEYRSKM